MITYLFTGSAVGRLAKVVIKAMNMDCLGNETKLSQCRSNVTNYCLSNDYVTLFCSRDTIVEKGSLFNFKLPENMVPLVR